MKMLFFAYRYSRLYRKLNHAISMMSFRDKSARVYANIGLYLMNVSLLQILLQEMKSSATQTMSGKEVVYVSDGMVACLERFKPHTDMVDNYAPSFEHSDKMPAEVFSDLNKRLQKDIARMMSDISMKIDMEFSQSLSPRYQNQYYGKLYRAAS